MFQLPLSTSTELREYATGERALAILVASGIQVVPILLSEVSGPDIILPSERACILAGGVNLFGSFFEEWPLFPFWD